ncbi:MAG: HDIG domain-containing protein, partial [Treponema sp.]|nr:HDIG domain-containing protein [Treponema sp.]
MADFVRGRLMGFLPERLGLLRMGRTPAIVCLASFVASVIVTVTFINLESEWQWIHGEFEVGMVADRDVIAGYPLSYIDEDATRLRMEAQRNLVPAVFRYLPYATDGVLQSWDEFSDFADRLEYEGVSLASVQLRIQAQYPGYFSAATIAAYFADPHRADFRGYGRQVLAAVLARRIFALDDVDLGIFNPDSVELLTLLGDRTERERISHSGIVSMRNVGDVVSRAADSLPPGFAGLAQVLLMPFVRENVVFSSDDTQMRLVETMERVPAVIRTIEQGQRIIRRDFLITHEAMQDLYALRAALPMQAPRNHAGKILLLALLYVLFILLQGRPVIGREFSVGQSCLLFALVFLYIAGAGLARSFMPGDYTVSLFFPTALLVMIPAVFMGHLAAFVLALAFPLSAVIVGFFDVPSYIFALISGLAASVVFRKAEKRMDLIKAGMKIAAANCLAVLVLLLMRAADFSAYPPMLLWAMLNGIVSGMLMLGVLPPLEHFLNAATTFRLIELSDLNAPVLRKLFTTAPGTYSHSVMVATLAEEACQDIGANALLARVGAYYHDIGKMENPDYFVENQTDYNRHDDIAPRLSATVIRSHLKIGVEKVRQLGLPEDVVDIVAEHHGNSLILWFYKKAEEQEGQVNPDDFTYP